MKCIRIMIIIVISKILLHNIGIQTMPDNKAAKRANYLTSKSETARKLKHETRISLNIYSISFPQILSSKLSYIYIYTQTSWAK